MVYKRVAELDSDWDIGITQANNFFEVQSGTPDLSPNIIETKVAIDAFKRALDQALARDEDGSSEESLDPPMNLG